MRSIARSVVLSFACAGLAACGDDGDGAGGAAGHGPAGSSAASLSAPASAAPSQSSAVASSSVGSTSASSSSGGMTPPDPDLPGAHAVEVFDDMVEAGGTNDQVLLHGFRPIDDAGPFPLVLVVPDAGITTTHYDGYLQRLATFGNVAVAVDYPVGAEPNHVKNATDVAAAIDWAENDAAFASSIDTQHTGILGHGLGGKIGLLLGQADARVVAVLGLDAVDATPSDCLPQYCPDASAFIHSLTIPTGFLAETLDGSTSCAATAESSATLYAGAPSPSFLGNVEGAAHTSFLDAPDTCGAPCTPCATPTIDGAVVVGLGRAYAAAFFAETLHGEVDYETYLTGAEAQARYVTPGTLSLSTK